MSPDHVKSQPPSERTPLVGDSTIDNSPADEVLDQDDEDTLPAAITPIRGLVVALMSGVLMLIQCRYRFPSPSKLVDRLLIPDYSPSSNEHLHDHDDPIGHCFGLGCLCGDDLVCDGVFGALVTSI